MVSSSSVRTWTRLLAAVEIRLEITSPTTWGRSTGSGENSIFPRFNLRHVEHVVDLLPVANRQRLGAELGLRRAGAAQGLVRRGGGRLGALRARRVRRRSRPAAISGGGLGDRRRARLAGLSLGRN